MGSVWRSAMGGLRFLEKGGRDAVGDDADHMHVVAISLFVTLLCACIVLGHLLEENRWMNESITALVLGLTTGVIVLVTSNGASSHILQFNEEMFFIYLLPPIIFNAGFQVKKKEFFRNFVPIVLFGVVGVFISFAIIATGSHFAFPLLGLSGLQLTDYLALGTIFSATDSVCTLQVLSQDDTPLLYSLVFGEGVVNDATSVVLFRAVQRFSIDSYTNLQALEFLGSFLYLFVSSTLLGVVVGLSSAYIIKTLYFGRHSTDREIAIMTLMAYLSYIIAELFYLSGILTVFFCGIVMSHYTWHNVTERSRTTTKHAFATMSFIAETFIFLYVGMDALDVDKWKMSEATAPQSVGLSATLVALVLLGRAAFVFPLSALSNYLHKNTHTKISFRQQIIIWWAGLMRGAVSIALAFNQFTISGDTSNPEHATAITVTISVVLFSTLLFGMMTKPLIGWLIPVHMRATVLSDEESEPPSPKERVLPSDDDLRAPLLPTLDESEPGASPAGAALAAATAGVARGSSLMKLIATPKSTVHKFWRKFDDSHMRPVFGGRGFVPQVPRSRSIEDGHSASARRSNSEGSQRP